MAAAAAASTSSRKRTPGKIFYTDVGCRLFDEGTCRCKDYVNRQATVEDCLQLTPEVVPITPWLPPTCGYRLVSEGKDLYWWHPLVSGDPETVHIAGVSVRGKMSGTEETIPDEELEDHLCDWPMEVPKAAKSASRRRERRRGEAAQVACARGKPVRTSS